MNSCIPNRGTILIFALFGVVMLYASVPDWWIEQNILPVDSDQTNHTVIQENYKPALIGQAKHMAYQAYLAIEAKQVGSAGHAIEAMVQNFTTDPADNYSPLLIGQLKAIAQPFYDRFNELNFSLGNIVLYANGYPWAPSGEMSENYKPANLGQLKYVFSFDLDSFVPSVLVDAGNDQIIALSESASLLGTVIDNNGQPVPLETVTILWTQVSGPGTTIFTNASALLTTASFSRGGSYVLKITVDSGDFTVFDELTILVESPDADK